MASQSGNSTYTTTEIRARFVDQKTYQQMTRSLMKTEASAWFSTALMPLLVGFLFLIIGFLFALRRQPMTFVTVVVSGISLIRVSTTLFSAVDKVHCCESLVDLSLGLSLVNVLFTFCMFLGCVGVTGLAMFHEPETCTLMKQMLGVCDMIEPVVPVWQMVHLTTTSVFVLIMVMVHGYLMTVITKNSDANSELQSTYIKLIDSVRAHFVKIMKKLGASHALMTASMTSVRTAKSYDPETGVVEPADSVAYADGQQVDTASMPGSATSLVMSTGSCSCPDVPAVCQRNCYNVPQTAALTISESEMLPSAEGAPADKVVVYRLDETNCEVVDETQVSGAVLPGRVLPKSESRREERLRKNSVAGSKNVKTPEQKKRPGKEKSGKKSGKTSKQAKKSKKASKK